MPSPLGANPVAASIAAAKGDGSLKTLVLAVGKIIVFVFIGWIIYGTPINNYEKNDDAGWDWGFVDCFYFTMATLTTVGYGDMPRLSQHMRLITIFFGLIGVLVIASSIGVIADWFVDRAKKQFIKKQQGLLVEAQAAGDLVRQGFGADAPGPKTRTPMLLRTGAKCSMPSDTQQHASAPSARAACA